MFSRPLPLSRPLALVLAVALSGVPALAAAGESPETSAAASAATSGVATPIADSARTAVQRYRGNRGRDDHSALKWTGFGLIAGGASLIAIGAVADDDCFASDLGPYDCDNVRKGVILAGGIMAGVGVGLMVMAANSGGRHRRYPSVTMQGGRMTVQQQVRF